MITPIDLTQFNGCTPGPWQNGDEDGNNWNQIHADVKGDLRAIWLANVIAKQTLLKAAQANARLIASAPALVAEVKALRECLAEMTERYSKLEVLYFKTINQDECPETNGTIKRARALLPK